MNIFLIGYRGTGKTFIGRKLAERLEYAFVDSDEEIVKRQGKTILEIFQLEGEEKFRDYETQELERISQQENQVVSCGGGIVMRPKNISLLKSGFVVLLTSSPEVILQRISRDKNRPALTNLNPLEEIKFMLAKRKGLYSGIKDFEIDTRKDGLNDYVERIIKAYEDYL